MKGTFMSRKRAVELVELFDSVWDVYLRDEVEEALTLREEITPLLLDILHAIADDPVKYAEEEHFAHNYAVTLLAHFREPQAHQPIIDAFNLPEEQLDLIWEAMVTERFTAIACRTAQGNYEAIKALVRDRNAFVFLRAPAMECISLAVALGEITREEALAFYESLLSDETLAEPGDYFWASVVGDLLDIYPGDLTDRIRDLYARGYVSEMEVSLREVDEVMADGLDKALERQAERLAWRVPEDVHRYISWFACFRSDENGGEAVGQLTNKSLQKKKAKSRVKRKQAKASKRKNRK
jgi:hypothetical protein